MTSEQHIENLKKLKSFHNGSYGDSINFAIKAIQTLEKYKEPYNKGWEDGTKAVNEHIKLCREERKQKVDKHCDRCGILLTKTNNKCGFDICDSCNELLEACLANKED